MPKNDGSVNDVYVCDGKGSEKDIFVNEKKLEISHENFCYIAGVIAAEDSSTFESAAATTQATFNAVKFEMGDQLTMEEQGKNAKKILAINGDKAYSTVPSNDKKSLEDSKNEQDYKNARKGLMHVLQGKKDYSEGGLLWDGIDFADKGIKHNKATKDGGISITKELWIKFINNCDYKSDKNKIFRLDRGNGEKDKTKAEALLTIPFENKKEDTLNESYVSEFLPIQNSTFPSWDISIGRSGLKNIDYFETEGTSKFNKGMTLNKATTVVGRQIFWKAYKEHPNNKGYYWKSYMNRL